MSDPSLPLSRDQVIARIEQAITRLGHIINDAPYRAEERDGAWAAFLENKKALDACLTLLRQPQALLCAIDGMDCTHREGGDTRHCRIDRPCWRCRAEKAEALLRQPQEPHDCEWIYAQDDGVWRSHCGMYWNFDDGEPPASHDVNFCGKCGKKLVVKPLPSPPSGAK